RLAVELQKLLGETLARQRPEARAATAGEDYGREHISSGRPSTEKLGIIELPQQGCNSCATLQIPPQERACRRTTPTPQRGLFRGYGRSYRYHPQPVVGALTPARMPRARSVN